MSQSRLPFYADTEVATHNVESDCWVTIFGEVYDLTPLLAANKGLLAVPIVKAAGQDISHWFDEKSREPVTRVSPETDMREPYLPHGRFIHVPPRDPDTTWDASFETPWWRDPRYKVGVLSRRKRWIRVVNTLTEEEHSLDVCCEETLEEIQRRYLKFNDNADKYVWKRLGRPLNNKKTLEENRVGDDGAVFDDLGVPDETYTPALHIYFDDQFDE